MLLMGAPGSGKSTQGQMLSEQFGWKWVSTGEILRQSKEPWIMEQMKTAKLFSDELIFSILDDALKGVQDAIIDGAVRTEAQAKKALERGTWIDKVVKISVPEDVLLQRVLARGRAQDAKEVAEQRFKDYFDNEEKILNILKDGGVEIVEVDGTGEPEEVQEKLLKVINQ